MLNYLKIKENKNKCKNNYQQHYNMWNILYLCPHENYINNDFMFVDEYADILRI